MYVQVYYTSASRLQLIPQTAKRACGRNLEICLDRSSATGDLVDIDVKVGLTRLSGPTLCQGCHTDPHSAYACLPALAGTHQGCLRQ